MVLSRDCEHTQAYHDAVKDRWACPCCGGKWVNVDMADMVRVLQERVKELEAEVAGYHEGWAGK